MTQLTLTQEDILALFRKPGIHSADDIRKATGNPSWAVTTIDHQITILRKAGYDIKNVKGSGYYCPSFYAPKKHELLSQNQRKIYDLTLSRFVHISQVCIEVWGEDSKCTRDTAAATFNALKKRGIRTASVPRGKSVAYRCYPERPEVVA